MSYRIINETQNFDIGRFVAMRHGMLEPWGQYTAIGLVRDDFLIAGVVYNHFGAANVNAHIGAIEGCRWLTPAFLAAMFDYPFNQLQKGRISACIRKKNKRAQAFVRKLGFKYEGCVRNYFGDDNMIVFGMLREECPYILGYAEQQERKAA